MIYALIALGVAIAGLVICIVVLDSRVYLLESLVEMLLTDRKYYYSLIKEYEKKEENEEAGE